MRIQHNPQKDGNQGNLKNNSIMNTTLQLPKSDKFRISQRSTSYGHIKMPKPLPDWKQSAASLRHSARLFKFAKDTRFKEPKVNFYKNQKLEYQSSLCKRATTFGFSSKKKIPEQFANNIGKQTVNCPFYEVQIRRVSSSVSLQPGKTFGLGWRYYEKSRTPHRSTVHCPQQVKANPGPQDYDTEVKHKNPYGRGKMHQRLRMFSQIDSFARKTMPNPQSYSPQEKLTSRIKSGTFIGYGQRYDFTKQGRKIPGPIYNISGFTDKFTQNKLKTWKMGDKDQ